MKDPLKMYDRDVATFNHDVKKKAGADMENLEDVVACDDVVASDMKYSLEAKNLDDEGF